MSEIRADDVCLKCGEFRGAIRREQLICWDGYDELGKHRFKPWPEPVTPTENGDTNDGR